MSRKICQMHLIFQILESREGGGSSFSPTKPFALSSTAVSMAGSRCLPVAFRNSRAHAVSMAGSRCLPVRSHWLITIPIALKPFATLEHTQSRWRGVRSLPVRSHRLITIPATSAFRNSRAATRWRGVRCLPIAFRISRAHGLDGGESLPSQ